VIAVTAVPGTTPSDTVTVVPALQPVVPFGFVYGPGTSWHCPGRTVTVLVIPPGKVGSPVATAVNVYGDVTFASDAILQIFSCTVSFAKLTIAS
jgi:hypothetical protein